MASYRSGVALKESINQLGEKGILHMWTFTLPRVLDIKDACNSWSVLLRDLIKEAGFSGIRVFELHKSHGVHVHCVVNKYYSVHLLRAIAFRNGWGRIHVIKCNDNPFYVAKYVAKSKREGCFRGRRIWASFGDLRKELTKCKDVVISCAKSNAYRLLEKTVWLKRIRAKGGRLHGEAYKRYIRLGQEIYFAWLMGERALALPAFMPVVPDVR